MNDYSVRYQPAQDLGTSTAVSAPNKTGPISKNNKPADSVHPVRSPASHPIGGITAGIEADLSPVTFSSGVKKPLSAGHPFSKPLGPFSSDTVTPVSIPNRLNQVWFGGQMPIDAVFGIANSRHVLPQAWRHVIVTDKPAEKAADFFSTLQLIDQDIILRKQFHPDSPLNDPDSILGPDMVCSNLEPGSPEFNDEFGLDKPLNEQEIAQLKVLRADYKRYADSLREVKSEEMLDLRRNKPYDRSLSIDSTDVRTGLGVKKELAVAHKLGLDSSLIQHEPGRSVVYVNGKAIEFVSSKDLVSAVRNADCIPNQAFHKLESEMNRQQNNFFAVHQKASDIARGLAQLFGGVYVDVDITLHQVPDLKMVPGKVAAYNNNNNILVSSENSGGMLELMTHMPDNWKAVEQELDTAARSDLMKDLAHEHYHPEKDLLKPANAPGHTPDFMLGLHANSFARRTAPDSSSTGYSKNAIDPFWLNGSFRETIRTTGPARIFSMTDAAGAPITEHRQSGASFAGSVMRRDGFQAILKKKSG